MTTKTAIVVAAFTATSLLVSKEASPEPYCEGAAAKWNGPMPIRWKLNTNFTTGYGTESTGPLCANSSCTFDIDVRLTVQAALSEYYNASGGKLRFQFGGYTNEPPGAWLADYVHIYADDNCSGANAGTASLYTSWFFQYGWIRICTQNTVNGLLSWDSYEESPGRQSLHKVILHEMGHVIGMEHQEVCYPGPPDPPPNASLMRLNTSLIPTPHLIYPELDFIHDLYGMRTTTGRQLWSEDALTWYTGAQAPPQASSVVGRFAATNVAYSQDMYVAWRAPDRSVVVSRYEEGGPWEYRSTIYPWSDTHPGIASSFGQQVAVTYQDNYSLASGYQDLWSSMSSDGGSTWTSWLQVSDANTSTAAPGVSSTFDPKSGEYIRMWRLSDGTIAYRIGTDPPLVMPFTKSPDTPSIACGYDFDVGQHNCLLAWVDSQSWWRIVAWTECQVADASGTRELACRLTRYHSKFSAGSPSVAYSFFAPYPWTLALNQATSATYIWRKQGDYDADFHWDYRSYFYSPLSVLPALGSLMNPYALARRYVFTMDE